MPTYYSYVEPYNTLVGQSTSIPTGIGIGYTEAVPPAAGAGQTQIYSGGSWSVVTDERGTYYSTATATIGDEIASFDILSEPTNSTEDVPPSISTAGYTYSWSGTAWSVVPKATLPEGDEVMSLGASGNAYKDLFVSEGTVYLGVHTLSVASNKLSYDGEEVVTGVGGTFETDFAHLAQAEIGLATVTTLTDGGNGQIDLDTDLIPSHNRTFNLGAPNKSWNKIFVKGGPKAIEFEGTGVGLGYTVNAQAETLLEFNGHEIYLGDGDIGHHGNLVNVYATGIVSAGGTVQAGIVTAEYHYGGFIGTFYNTTGNPILRSADESFGGTVYGDIISNATSGFSTFHDILVSGMTTVGILTAEYLYGGFIGTIYNTTGNPILRSADESFGGTVYGNVFSNLTTGISSFHDLTASGVITATEFHGDGSELTNIVADSGQVEVLYADVRNTSGSSIDAGTPVYITGYNQGSDRYEIAPADASNSSTMPAAGILKTTLADSSNGEIGVYGQVTSLDTSDYSDGDELWVAVGAGLTSVRPAGATELVQKIGQVLRAHESTGVILIKGAGRTNDTPNSVTSQLTETSSTTDNATRYVSFVPNNSTGAGQTVFTNTDLKYNPSTGNLTVGGDVLTSSVRTSTLYPVGGATVSIAASLVPSADYTYDLGSSSNRWKDLFLDGGQQVLNIGDVAIGVTDGHLVVDGREALDIDTQGDLGVNGRLRNIYFTGIATGYNAGIVTYYGDGSHLDLPVNSAGSGAIAMKYKSSNTTTMSDPGSGKWRLNNLNQATATQMAVDIRSGGGYNINAILSAITVGTKIFLQRKDNPDAYHTFIVNAAPTLQGTTSDGWYLFSDITNLATGGTGIPDNKDCVLAFKAPNQIKDEHVTPSSIDTVGIVTAASFSTGNEAMTFDVVGSNLIVTVAGIGSTTLALG